MTTSDNIAAISKALEGVDLEDWIVNGDRFSVETSATFIPDQKVIALCATGDGAMGRSLYIAACNPVAISALLAEARKAEAMEQEIAAKDARIAALEAGVSDLVEIARLGVPAIPPDGPTSPEHQAAYEATGFTLVEIRNRARTLLNGGSDAQG